MLTEMQEKLLARRGFRFRRAQRLPDGTWVAEATKDFHVAGHLGQSATDAVRNLIQLVTRR